MILKYVIYDFVYPVLFPRGINHSDILFNNKKPTSAGFCKINMIDGELFIRCFGESLSLKLKSHSEDVDIIKTFISSKEIFDDIEEVIWKY